MKHDSERLQRVHELIAELARGNLEARAELSPELDELDAILVSLNLLAEEFADERVRRQRAEAGLQDAVSAYDHAPALFCSVDPHEFKVTRLNLTMARALGLEREAVVGTSLLDRYPDGERAHARRCLEAIAAGATVPPGQHLLECRDGPPRIVLLSGTRALDASGAPAHLRLIYRDVTEERTLEAQLQRAQKLDAIGRLAGGVAHDFNNLLTVMQGITEALCQEPQSPSARLELDDLGRAVQQASELTRSLLTFSRRTPVAPGLVDVNAVIARCQRLLERVLGTGVTLRAQFAPDACFVNADSHHLEQVVLNLVLNARDAMPQGGPIEVATRQLELRAGAPQLLADQSPGRWVELSVTDRGTGIPPEVQPRVFEPFFSTKPAGRGTGLGLAIVYGVVKQAGGLVSFDTTPGQGTTFRVLLPRSVEVSPPAPIPETAGPLSQATLLCVDDDATVLRLTARLLRNAGYTVLEANGGEAAVSLMRQRGTPVDLVVCDVVMPGMAGPSVVQLLLAEQLAARAIFVSGFTADLGALQAPLVRKPFTASELLERVREVLVQLSPSPFGRGSG